jgi:hypothetical protein
MSIFQVLPGQLCRILHRGDLDRASAAIHAVAIDLHLAREAAMHGIETEQMGVGLDWSDIVYGDDLDISAAGFHGCPQHKSADTAESTNGDPDRHFDSFIAS